MIKWHPGIYDPIAGTVNQIITEMDTPDEVSRDKIVYKIAWWKYPTYIGVQRAVYAAMLDIGYVRKLPRDTRKIVFIRADLPNGVYNDHEIKVRTYKCQYAGMMKKIKKIIEDAGYPDFISIQRIICELSEMGIDARTRQMKTVITYLMPSMGYDIERNLDGTMRKHKKYQTYYKVTK